MTVLGYISKKMSKVFYLNSSKFFVGLFLGMLIFFSHTPNQIPPAYYLFDFLDLITDFLDFLDLKTVFRPKKTFFRPKQIFLDVLDLKTDF